GDLSARDEDERLVVLPATGDERAVLFGRMDGPAAEGVAHDAVAEAPEPVVLGGLGQAQDPRRLGGQPEPRGEAAEVGERAVEERLGAVAPVEMHVRVDEDWPAQAQGSGRLHGSTRTAVPVAWRTIGPIVVQFSGPAVRTHLAPARGRGWSATPSDGETMRSPGESPA